MSKRRKTPLPVAEKIRDLYEAGTHTQVELAALFDLSQPAISRIVNGLTRTGLRKRRQPGPTSVRRALTPEQVREIKKAATFGLETQDELAARFRVSQSLVSSIVSGKVYADVTSAETERTSERINAWALESKRKAGLLREAQVGRCPKCDREVALGIIREGACYYCRYETAPGLTSASDG